MKKFFKRTLSVLLAVVMVTCSVPLAGLVGVKLPDFGKLFATDAKAIEASDLPADFDLTLYNVNMLFDSNYGEGTTFKVFKNNVRDFSIAKSLYNEFEQNTTFILSVEAWEAIRLVSNPSNLAEYLKFQQQYEEVIFAVLFSALKNEKFEEFSYSNGISKITSLTNKIITSGKNAELLDKTSLDGTERKELINTAFAFLTEGKDVESKWSAFGDYLEISNKFLKFTENVASAINIINSASMYVSMLDAGSEVLSYLKALKSKAPNSAFGGAVQTVIDTISHDWLGVVEKTIVDSGFVFCMPAVKKLIDYAWTGCCAICPFLGGMTIGEGIGVLATNILFASEDTIEQYEYLKIITQLETASNVLLEQYGKSCSVSVNIENSAELMFAVDFSYSLYCMGAEASIEMANIAYNKGLINSLINIFSTGSKIKFEQYEESVGHFLDSRKTEYNNVKCYWKYCIEDVFPEFFTVLEEENITPKYIEEVNIEKDEAIFRVGDAMYFKWTLSPIDYEGEIGLKSDNEAVIKSREPMGILPLALEENIGTANVTIYSIDNPEICDTIKITVIGENDEGTTEAEQNIVSGKCGDNLTWTLNKSTGRLVISGSGNMKDFDNDYYYTSAPWQNYHKEITSVIICDGVTSIGNYAFTGYTYPKLTRILIGNTVKSIGEYAFVMCKNLKEIRIPNGALSIGREAFKECTSLENLTIGEGDTTIEFRAFYNCKNLKKVTIGKGRKIIKNSVFEECTNLTDVYYLGDVSSWCEITFEYDESNPMKYADNLYMDGVLFEGDLIIPDGFTSIGNYSFYNCSTLTNLIIPSSVTKIGAYAFYNCSALTNVIIPRGVTEIGAHAFFNCSALTSATIPDTITKIGAEAFVCEKLKEVHYDGDIADWCRIDFEFSGSNPLAGVDCFFADGVSIEGELIIPNSVTEIKKYAFAGFWNITSLKIPESVKTIGEFAFASCINLTEVILPDSINDIGNGAFDYCKKLSNIVLPNSLNTINRMTFYRCENLTNIIIPNGVKTIRDNAFYCCEKLVNITIPDTVASIGHSAFEGCSNITGVYIQSNITQIEKETFYGCYSLENISLPESITRIDDGAFWGCNSLKSVFYEGSKEQWNNILIGLDNNKLTNATIHFNYNANSHVHSISDWQIVLNPTVETTGKKIKKCTVCGATVAEETIAKLPKEPVKDSSVVKTPSTSSVSYGDSITLHIDASTIPAGGHVEWTASNDNFTYSVSSDGTTCTVSPSASGDTTFTATIYDSDGNAVSIDEQTMTSKAGFFQKIIAFFKKLFGLTKVIPEAIKNIV